MKKYLLAAVLTLTLASASCGGGGGDRFEEINDEHFDVFQDLTRDPKDLPDVSEEPTFHSLTITCGENKTSQGKINVMCKKEGAFDTISCRDGEVVGSLSGNSGCDSVSIWTDCHASCADEWNDSSEATWN